MLIPLWILSGNSTIQMGKGSLLKKLQVPFEGDWKYLRMKYVVEVYTTPSRCQDDLLFSLCICRHVIGYGLYCGFVHITGFRNTKNSGAFLVIILVYA